MQSTSRRIRRRVILGLAALAAIAAVAPATSQADVRVMSRNLYLGADLSPGTNAGSFQELVNAAGQILHQVDQNDFRIRAKVLAHEILNQNPDLVGLQEGALWRKAPCTDNPLAFTATQVRPGRLPRAAAQRAEQGRAALSTSPISEPEFDFQVWANMDGNESTSAPGCPYGSETEGRLTMRDAILARTGGTRHHLEPAGRSLQHAAAGEAWRMSRSTSPAAGRASTRRSPASRSSGSSTPTSRRSTTS